ncbi:hypothetical protein DNTS_008215, partial [Danionella cerebrum]
ATPCLASVLRRFGLNRKRSVTFPGGGDRQETERADPLLGYNVPVPFERRKMRSGPPGGQPTPAEQFAGLRNTGSCLWVDWIGAPPRYGDVVDCVIMKDKSTNQSRGFGFVKFKDPNCVRTVLDTKPHNLDGRNIDPKPCTPRGMQPEKTRTKDGWKGSKSDSNKSKKIFVGGIPHNCGEAELRDYFNRFGAVTEVVMIYDAEKQRPRGKPHIHVCSHYVSLTSTTRQTIPSQREADPVHPSIHPSLSCAMFALVSQPSHDGKANQWRPPGSQPFALNMLSHFTASTRVSNE